MTEDALHQTNGEPDQALGAPPEAGENQPAGPTPETPPTEYADFTMPTGMSANPEVVTQFKGLAKEAGLSQAQAQQFADLGAGLLQRWQTAQDKTMAETRSQHLSEWAQSTKTDPEFGGAKYTERLNTANTAFTRFSICRSFNRTDCRFRRSPKTCPRMRCSNWGETWKA